MKSEFSEQIFEKILKYKFLMKILLAEAKLLHVDRQTWRS